MSRRDSAAAVFTYLFPACKPSSAEETTRAKTTAAMRMLETATATPSPPCTRTDALTTTHTAEAAAAHRRDAPATTEAVLETADPMTQPSTATVSREREDRIGGGSAAHRTRGGKGLVGGLCRR